MLSPVAASAIARRASTIRALPLKYRTAATAHNGPMTRKLIHRNSQTSSHVSHLLPMTDKKDRPAANAKGSRNQRFARVPSLRSSRVRVTRFMGLNGWSAIRLQAFSGRHRFSRLRFARWEGVGANSTPLVEPPPSHTVIVSTLRGYTRDPRVGFLTLRQRPDGSPWDRWTTESCRVLDGFPSPQPSPGGRGGRDSSAVSPRENGITPPSAASSAPSAKSRRCGNTPARRAYRCGHGR